MNRGFGYYFNKNVKAAAKTVLHGGNLFKFYVSFFTWILYLIIPFLNAVTPVVSARRAQIASEENTVSPLRELSSADGGKSFGAALLCGVIRLFVTVGGLMVFAALGALLGYVGYAIGISVQISNPYLLPVIFAIPAAICAIVYLIATALLFAPCGYLLNSHSGKVSATSVLNASVQTMKRGGKGTCFLNAFVPYLIIGAMSSIASGGLYVINYLMRFSEYALIACAVWIAVAAIIIMVFAPVFVLTHTMCNYDLFKDIALDPTALYNSDKGVFIKRVKTNTMSARGLDSNLAELFERTSESVIRSDTAYSSPFEQSRQMHEYDPNAQPEPQPPENEAEQPEERSFDFSQSGEQPQENEAQPPESEPVMFAEAQTQEDEPVVFAEVQPEQPESDGQNSENPDSDLI